MNTTRISGIIEEEFRFLVDEHGFHVQEKHDDPSGSNVFFVNNGVCVVVYYERYSRECDVEFKLNRNDGPYRLPLFEILRYAGDQNWRTIPRANTTDQIHANMALLAEQCRKFGTEAIMGNQSFYEDVKRFSGTSQEN